MESAGVGRTSLTVLVVDDEPLVRGHAIDLFEDLCHEVLEAPDVLEAPAILRERSDGCS